MLLELVPFLLVMKESVDMSIKTITGFKVGDLDFEVQLEEKYNRIRIFTTNQKSITCRKTAINCILVEFQSKKED